TQEFDWQKQWGTVHLNTLADKLRDPVIAATKNGVMHTGGRMVQDYLAILKAAPPFELTADKQIKGGEVDHGIKFDFKNSIVNCMSRPIPTFAINRGSVAGAMSYGKNSVCGRNGVAPMQYPDAASNPKTILFAPLWDFRSNDKYTENDKGPGCGQQITNQCARDIHECRWANHPGQKSGAFMDGQGKGYLHPVTHFFSEQEVHDLCGTTKGCSLPTKYYAFTKKIDEKRSRVALSVKDPSGDPSRVAGTPVHEVNNERDDHLARIKTYNWSAKDRDASSDFIIADPTHFFDMNLYTAGGKYASGYNEGPKGNQILETCPILADKTGYGGICDPTGKAGCNLAVYGVGAQTKLTTVNGQEYRYTDYPVRWSGYVKRWAFISPEQFKKNVEKRVRNKANLYDLENLNDNDILMITQSEDYCETNEMASDPSVDKPIKDMPCVHYLQYQPLDEAGKTFGFVDLYAPAPDVNTISVSYSMMQMYKYDDQGKLTA
ncbi:hypothetical protein EBZ37_11870, partial [bacterium]|nr:hypothetical protein [bacterium]